MQRFTLDAEAGQVSSELARRGLGANVRVHVVIEVVAGGSEDLAMAAIAQAGGAFDWLADEPELYTDADLTPQRFP